MLLIEIPRIPPEGLDLDEALDVASLHLEGETEFALRPGARIRCHVDLVDGTTVHVRGRLAGEIELECGRCLEPYAQSAAQELDLFYLPRVAGQALEQEEDVELGDRDVVVGYYQGDRLDLAEAMREQIVLALPLRRLCRETCLGRCASCGRDLNQGPCSCPPAEEPLDPRLATLRKLIDRN